MKKRMSVYYSTASSDIEIYKYNLEQNICRLFHVLTVSFRHMWNGARLLPSKSEATCSLPTCQKTWLRTWGSWIWWRGPSWPPKRQILTFVVENHKKSAVKHSTDIPIVLNFVNLIVFLILDTITADYWW